MTVYMNTKISGGDITLHLEQNAPLFPTVEIRSFVAQYIARREEFLELLNCCAAPLYVVDTSTLKERSKQFQEAFRKYLPDTGYYYAVKSNNHPDVATTLMKTGMGLDVSSGVELEMALGLGATDIVFSGPGKTDTELRLVVENAERVILLMDSFGELTRLKKITNQEHKIVRAGVRLTTNPTGLWRKFGILPEQLGKFWYEVQQAPYIDFQGLQFHTSWNLAPVAQVDFLRLLGGILSGLPVEACHRIKFIDIGGGYWPMQGEWLQPAGTKAGKLKIDLGMEPGNPHERYRLPACSIEDFAREIGSAVLEHIARFVSCRICMEPGRWLCNDAMHLLLSVVDRKGDDLVITDAGTNTIGWERFESDYFPVINLSRPSLRENTCMILGSLCTPHDVWGYSFWGEDIQVGDILMVPTQGAYTYSLRQQFIKPLPEVVIM